MERNTYYITTPIYYVNGSPHIGHAYTSLACDVLARFMRLAGKEVFFLTGTDEHGQKVAKSAFMDQLSPQEFCDNLSERFRDLGKIMNFSNDDFIRTTEDRHKEAVSSLWKKLSNHIYLGKYSGWYSVRDEAFYAESELTDGLAPTGAPVEWLEEESYFFELSKWQDKLLDFYENNPDFIKPESRRNEIVNFIKSGLQDLSISRTSFKWGIPVPGNSKHIIYVWLDALTNYISAIGYPNVKSEKFKKFWPCDIHIIGKDISRFHAIYWPAFLMAADIELPKKIFAHGWWTNEGQKISKSLGNTIDPIELVEKYGLDQVRYFLMREVFFGQDGNFSKANLVLRVNAELANNIGNLVQRTLSFINKYVNKQVPEVSIEFISNLYKTNNLILKADSILKVMYSEMDNQNFSNVLENIIGLSSLANIYIDGEAPWRLIKEDIKKMNEILYTLCEVIKYIAILLLPFIPDSSNKILDFLSVEENLRNFKSLSFEHHLKPGTVLPDPQPIIPRIYDTD